MERQTFSGAEHYGRAAFTYAGQSNTNRITHKRSRLPGWLSSASDLDYLNPASPFFTADRALFSCGPYLHATVPSGNFSKRKGVTILGDSGGYQFIGKPSVWQGDRTRAWVLQWLESATDEAMTLDIPTKAIAPGTPWPDFSAALACTQDSLRYFDAHRSGMTRFLNVIQGRDRAEALTWYEAVKWFPAGGWALGGSHRKDFAHVVRLLRQMHTDGLLGRDRNRVHVLGLADLESAVALSAIQRGMRRYLDDDDFLITFDVSSPGLMTASGQCFGHPALSATSFGMTYWKPPSVVQPGYEQARWPVLSSAVGAHIRMDDLLVGKPGSIAQTAWDGLSYAMLVNHNVHSLYAAIEQANRVMELHPSDAATLAPARVIRAYQALLGSCTAKNPLSYLRPYIADIARMGR